MHLNFYRILKLVQVLNILPFLLLTIFGNDNVFRVSFLFEHYCHHRQVDDISLINYLILHYADDNHSNADSEHQKLPFKSEFSYPASVCFFVFSENINILQLLEMDLIRHRLNNINTSMLDICKSVWHPPK